MHFLMRRIFFENYSFCVTNISLVKNIGRSFPKLTLVPCQNPIHFISKLAKTIKVEKVYSAYISGDSNDVGSSYQLSSLGYSQPGSQGFILVSLVQSTMASNIIG